MDIVLGVSMESAAVRMVLVEGEKADGATVDHDTRTVSASTAAELVVAAIQGTRENAADGAHRLTSTGVVWTDHSAAAELRRALRAHRIDGVVMVSELHAASALAQALGRAMGADRIALLFLDAGSATVAVVRTRDGAVTRVHSRGAAGTAELHDMVGRLEGLTEPPQAVFVVGSGVDVSAAKAHIAAVTRLPVHAPLDADLALARGAALASASTPRFEAETVGLAPRDDTQAAAGLTQAADAAYMAPLGYSAMPDEGSGDLDPDPLDVDSAEDIPAAEPRPFFLVGSALAALFVLGMAALVISLAVTVRPTADQRPDPGAATAATEQAPAPAAPETIQAPVPVVQEAPRTVFVAPDRAPSAVVPAPVEMQSAPAPAAPAPIPAPAPAAEPPPAAAPAPAAPAPVVAAPAPAIAPIPIVVPIPPALVLPPILQSPVRRSPTPVTQAPVTPGPATQSPITQAPVPQATQPSGTQAPATTSAPATSTPAYTPPAATTPAPAAQTPAAADSGSGSPGSDQSGASQSSSSPAQSGATTSRNPLWPLWPGFNR